jgi:hypothetical protein
MKTIVAYYWTTKVSMSIHLTFQFPLSSPMGNVAGSQNTSTQKTSFWLWTLNWKNDTWVC